MSLDPPQPCSSQLEKRELELYPKEPVSRSLGARGAFLRQHGPHAAGEGAEGRDPPRRLESSPYLPGSWALTHNRVPQMRA